MFWGKGIVMWGVFVLTDWIGIKVSGMIVSDRKSTIIVNFQARHSINLTIDSKTERIMKNDSYSIATLLIQFAQSFFWLRGKILKQTGFLNWIYTFRNQRWLGMTFFGNPQSPSRGFWMGIFFYFGLDLKSPNILKSPSEKCLKKSPINGGWGSGIF